MRINIRNKQAFTLIELLMALLILSIILAVFVPLSTKSFKNLQLTDTAKSIISIMKYLQNKAVLEGKIYRLDFDLENTAYSVSVQIEEEANKFQEVKTSLLSKKKLTANLKIESLVIKHDDVRDEEETSVYFYLDGSMDEAEIVLAGCGGEKIAIQTNLSGEISVGEEEILPE
ncbi:MAG: prepilin-type N-terminal cleavage/methylation domain-containing protein [Candidatus Omnitrophota bacterium]